MFDQAKPSHSLPSSGPKAVESEEPSSSGSVISSDLTISKSFDSGGSIDGFRNDENRARYAGAASRMSKPNIHFRHGGSSLASNVSSSISQIPSTIAT